MAYVYKATDRMGHVIVERFVTLRGARRYADQMIPFVKKGWSIEKVSRRAYYTVTALVVLLMAAISFPSLAFADEEQDHPSSGSSQLAAASSGELDDAGAQDSQTSGNSASPSQEAPQESQAQEVEQHDYSNVVNEQVVGDFFFMVCVDTVLLLMVVGALGFIVFRPRR